MTWVGYIGAIVLILVSIMLHEAGHFATSKAFGMKATQFFVGFGPTLWSRRRGETEYGVKAIPAGGFVKIIGMTELEEIEPGDEDRVFYKQPAGQRAVVLSAGSVVHFILAILITYLVLVFAGNLVSPTTQLEVASVPKCVYLSTSQTACKPGDPASPAYGVLKAGDQILAVDGTPVGAASSIATFEKAGQLLHITVLRHGHRLTVAVRPVTVRTGSGTKARIGVLEGTAYVYPSVSALGGVPRTFDALGTYLSGTGRALGALPSTVAGIFQGKPRNANGPVSIVGAVQVSGQIFGAAGVPLHVRVGGFFLLIAELNFFIGLFNLLPLLPLDGGHIAILGFEVARSRLYRLFRRPDPGRVDINKVLPVTYAVMVLFVGLAVVLLYADIVHPLNLSG